MLSFLSGIFSTATVLDFLGLQTKRSVQSRTFNSVALLVAGAAVGAGVALLYAPRPGYELRHDLRDRAQKLGSRVGQSPMVQNARRRIGAQGENIPSQNVSGQDISGEHASVESI